MTFPSFHTALAILFVYSSRPPCRMFIPLFVLNLTMLLAIPFAGDHYLADMIGGAIVVAASILVTRRAMRRRHDDLPTESGIVSAA
ncbi:MAG: phosphatase PAP2 family protein [Candidatus Binataceae bacterium]